MKFGQFIEYNMINIFFKKILKKIVRETNHKPFSKQSKLSISLDQLFQHLYSLFSFYVQVKSYQNLLKLRSCLLGSISYKRFLKIKKRSETSLPASFSVCILKRNISHVYSINWPNFIVWLLLLFETLDNVCIVIVCFPVCDVKILKLTLAVLSSRFPT